MTLLRRSARRAPRLLGAWTLAVLIGAPLGRAAPATEDADARPLLSREDVFELEYASDPQLAPDGRRLVYVRRSNDIMTDRTRSSLWLAALDGSDHRPLVTEGPGASQPRWSPTGERLAYLRAVEGQSQIHVRWMDTGATTAITSVRENPSSLSWSPDGRWLAFTMSVAVEGPKLVSPPSKPEGASWAEPRSSMPCATGATGAGSSRRPMSTSSWCPPTGARRDS